MANFFAELKRRHIYRVAAAYAVVAWVVIQLVNNITPMLNLPSSVGTIVLVLLAAGFPIALVFAWILQLASTDGATARAATGKLDWLLIGALVAVLAMVSYQQLAPTNGVRTAQQQANAAPAATAQPSATSIAVLPFANVSGDSGQEFFSDGMTDEIMTALAKIPSLQVVARTSAFEFKGQNRNIQTIGQQLHSRYVIAGSVRKEGTRVRITAQLVQTDNGVSLWTDSYDGELTSVFATQEDIARAIAGALRVPLGLQQGQSLVSERTSDLDSYQQYLRAKAAIRARGTDVARATNILESVVARDPGFAPAWGLLAQAYGRTNVPGVSTGSVEDARRAVESYLEKSEKAAREAVRLDSRNANGYAALAGVQAREGKWVEAEDLYKQALARDSNDPEVLDLYSSFLRGVGRLKDSLRLSEQMRTLEPFVPGFVILTAEMMSASGQSAAAIPILEAIPASAAGDIIRGRNVALAQAYARTGRYSEAADTLLLITGTQVSRKSVEDAVRIMRTAPTKVIAPEALPALAGLGFVYAFVGAFDRASEGMERNFEIHTFTGGGLWFPENAPMRKTERFKAFVRKVGFVDYWRERGWPDLCRPEGANDFVCD